MLDREERKVQKLSIFCWTSFMYGPLFEYIDTPMANGIKRAFSTAKFHGQGAEK